MYFLFRRSLTGREPFINPVSMESRMVDEPVKDELRSLIEGTARDLDWAIEKYNEAESEVEERLMEDVSDEQRREFALGMVESENIFKDRVGGSGTEMEIEILAIGQGGRMEDWGQDDDTVVYSYGFIYGPLGDNGKQKAARAVFINKGAHLDLTNVQRNFRALNTMKGVYEVSESDDLDGVYRCFSSGSSQIKETELDSLPGDRDDKLEILRQATPEAELATLREDMSAYDPESNYTHDFGADLRRIEAKVVDYYCADDGSWGRYTIMDDSVTTDDIVDTDIVGDDQNVPGLTVWADPDYHMEYGRKTRANFYGTVEEGGNGNLVMNLVGVVPIIPMPMDDDESADEKAKSTETKL